MSSSTFSRGAQLQQRVVPRVDPNAAAQWGWLSSVPEVRQSHEPAETVCGVGAVLDVDRFASDLNSDRDAGAGARCPVFIIQGGA